MGHTVVPRGISTSSQAGWSPSVASGSPTNPATPRWWCRGSSSGDAAGPPGLTVVAQVDEDLEQPVLPSRTPEPTTRTVTFSDGALRGAERESVVADAVRRIQAGDLEKVVLARDLLAQVGTDFDVRGPLRRLARGYPMCWTFHVDGWFGATRRCLCAASAAWSSRGC